jgi:hypothetical protein
MAATIERYARAMNSENLRGSAIRLVDVDVLTGSGWCAQHNALAALLHRARVHLRSPPALRAAQAALRRYALRRATVLRYAPHSACLAADAVLAWLLHPLCPQCHGVRFVPIAGTGHLSDIACPQCHGTGQAATTYRGDAFAEALHCSVESKMEVFERHLARRLNYT